MNSTGNFIENAGSDCCKLVTVFDKVDGYFIFICWAFMQNGAKNAMVDKQQWPTYREGHAAVQWREFNKK